MSPQPSVPMLTALVQLHDALQESVLPLDLPEVESARTELAEIVAQLGDYVLPRLIEVDAPLLTVVGGSTGAGKSTLVNSLVGEVVTEAGVLRPTTRSPVLVHNPLDAAWFDELRILPDFERTSRASADPGALQLVASEHVPEGLAILDAPDIDSVEQRNRELAAQLLAAADMWLFVTSAARYADQVPWEYLRKAAERSAAVAVVLDRTAPLALPEVAAHLSRMLSVRGLRDSPLFEVAEADLDDDGLLPARSVVAIQEWLEALAADTDARSGVIRQTLAGAIRTITRRTYVVADACDAQSAQADQLRAEVAAAYDEALKAIHDAVADGSILRGEVATRWAEFVGSGELLDSLEQKVSWARDRLSKAVKGQPTTAARAIEAVESSLAALVSERADTASEAVERAWSASATSAGVLSASLADPARSTADLRARTRESVTAWRQCVVDLVRAEGADKRTTARFLAYGVNGLALALMVVVLAPAEARGGSEALAAKLLGAAVGEPAAGRLVAAARQDLDRRVELLLEGECRRRLGVVDALGVAAGRGDRLRTLARRVDDLRLRREDGL